VSGGFQPSGFQGPPGFQQFADVTAEITQTLPSLTQSLTGTVEVVTPEEPGKGGGIFLAPGVSQIKVKARITQTLPSLTQHMEVDVNDDELVLLLLLV
jgi:hypothetical protein